MDNLPAREWGGVIYKTLHTPCRITYTHDMAKNRKQQRNHLIKHYNLPVKKAVFVVEYLKDFATRRAAEASGYSPDHGYDLLKQEKVQCAIDEILQERLEENMIDTDWVLHEMVDNHVIARQQGNISASNTALNMICKHKRVDAFAADKIKVSTDADVADRLVAARERRNEQNEESQINGDDISFF